MHCICTYVYCVYIHQIVILGNASITERMATVTISDLQCGVTYNITAEGILNERPVGPGSSHGNITSGPCPMPSPMSCPKPSSECAFIYKANIYVHA